jgi:hypothetical protein
VWVTAIGGLALAMIVLLLLTPFWGFAFIIAVGLTTAFQALLSLTYPLISNDLEKSAARAALGYGLGEAGP